jgi:hypothetical protein
VNFATFCRNGNIAIHGGGNKAEGWPIERELYRKIIYATKLSKKGTKSHVGMQFTVYLINCGARLTLTRAYTTRYRQRITCASTTSKSVVESWFQYSVQER